VACNASMDIGCNGSIDIGALCNASMHIGAALCVTHDEDVMSIIWL